MECSLLKNLGMLPVLAMPSSIRAVVHSMVHRIATELTTPATPIQSRSHEPPTCDGVHPQHNEEEGGCAKLAA